MNWKEYFDMMADWKHLPAYKAEPRIDSLVGFYLKEIVSDHLKNDKIIGIIPEFPLRLGTLAIKEVHKEKKYADLSYKVDFYLLGESGTNYFVEFKTDSGSRNSKQDGYLKKAIEITMPKIVEGIHSIFGATLPMYKHKYEHLIKKLKQLELIDDNKTYKGKIEIIYVQPRQDNILDATVIGFEAVSEWLKTNHGNSEYELALANALSGWATH